MKKSLTISTVVLMIFSVLFFYSCNDDENITTIEETQNKVMFEDHSIKSKTNPEFTENHFYLIEKIGENEEKTAILDVVQAEGIKLSTVNTNDLKKFYPNNTGIIMYSMPVLNDTKKVIVYQYRDTYQVSIADLYNINDTMKQFELKTLDNQPVYSLKVDEDNRIGDINISDNTRMATFNNQVYDAQLTQHSLVTGKPGEICCRNEEQWSDCVDCLVSTCQANFKCEMFYSWFEIEMYIGFSLACIGTGPEADCVMIW